MVGIRNVRPTVIPARDLQEIHGLTPREAQVASLLAGGASNAHIAARLDVRPSTARRHTENVLRKLGVRSRSEVPAKLLRSS